MLVEPKTSPIIPRRYELCELRIFKAGDIGYALVKHHIGYFSKKPVSIFDIILVSFWMDRV